MSWHVEPEMLARYVTGEADQARAFSVEAHLLACATCRGQVAGLADSARLARVWVDVQETLDAPRPGPVEGLLVRFGLPEHLARLLGATPSLTLSWLSAVALSLAFAVTAAHYGPRGLLLFLALAPLLPLAGVAAAFGPGLDPTYEIGLACPIRTVRLLLIRAGAVLATTTALAGAAGLALPVLDWRAAAWLSPALALTLLSLALATFLPAAVAFGSVAVLWTGGVVLTALVAGDQLVVFRGIAQYGFVVVALVASAIVVERRESFEFRRRS